MGRKLQSEALSGYLAASGTLVKDSFTCYDTRQSLVVKSSTSLHPRNGSGGGGLDKTYVVYALAALPTNKVQLESEWCSWGGAGSVSSPRSCLDTSLWHQAKFQGVIDHNTKKWMNLSVWNLVGKIGSHSVWWVVETTEVREREGENEKNLDFSITYPSKYHQMCCVLKIMWTDGNKNKWNGGGWGE